MEAAEISYRQMDFWFRQGYLTAQVAHRVGGGGLALDPHGDPRSPGSGHYRVLAPKDVDRLFRVARLVRVGFAPEVAADLAERLAGGSAVSLGHGLFLKEEAR